MRSTLLSLLLLLPVLSFSQSAIDLDGLDDKISLSNGAGLVANGPMSLAMWVYPTNSAPNFPNLDGFAGIRNNVDADFYIIQIGPAKVEARFRNSAGTKFDVIFDGMALNEWNHFVLTYDLETLTLYYNGEQAGSVPANGLLSNATASFDMGFLPYFSNTFSLDGKLDDVCLWSKALSIAEVETVYNSCEVPLDMEGLQLCYRFEDGTPGGDNTGLTQVVDSKSEISAPLTGFALTGESSNFVEFIHTGYAILSESTCGEPYTSPSGNYTWTVSGNYLDTVASPACTEILSIYLTVVLLDTSITQTGPGTLTANAAGALYQWIDCGTGEPVAGATQKTFEATETGSYAVVITQLGCSDTSSCYSLVVNSIYDPLEQQVRVFPNPAGHTLTVRFDTPVEQMQAALTDVNGREIPVQQSTDVTEIRFDVSGLPAGLYFIRLSDGNKAQVVKWIKR